MGIKEKKRQRKPKGQSRKDNLEKQTEEERRRAKKKKKTKNDKNNTKHNY